MYGLEEVFVPPSLIDEFGCTRKGSKAVPVNRLGVTVCNPPSPDKLLVDASQLLYHIVWPSSGTEGYHAIVAALGDKCKGLLGMHTLSGCDKRSYNIPMEEERCPLCDY